MITRCEDKISRDTTTSTKVHSFDIFDTLFTRRTAQPIGIFKIMQYKLIRDAECPARISDNFVMLRIESELYVRKNLYETNGAEDVTLDEIYDFMQLSYGLSDSLVNKIKNLEIELEINNVVPLKKNIELFKELKSKSNNNVILVSDMYLPESVIRRMLAKADPCFEDVKLYLSCECNHRTKHYGSLYDYVKEQENIDLANWQHYGDNPHADIYRANEKGINSNMLPQLEINSFGYYLINRAPNDCIIDAIVGASRLSQLKDQSIPYKLGASMTGPLLYSYVNWVLNDAIEKGFKDLYFVARDGYILKLIADEIIHKRNYDLNSHYLYGSRYAWRIINENNYNDIIDYCFDEYFSIINETLLAKRLCIEVKDIQKYFGTSYNDFSDKKKYIKMLKSNTEFKDYIISVHSQKEKLLIKYVQQECGENPANIVLVDLDGSGRTQDCFQNAISSTLDSVVHCYYFFQFFNAIQKDKSIKHSYLLTVDRFNNWIEILTRNCEGQTVSYQENNGKIVPVLDEFSPEQMKTWGYDDYITGIKNYVNNIIDFEKVNNIQIESYMFFLLLDDYKNSSIDSEFMEVLGSVIYEDIGTENKQCAEPISFKDCIGMLLGKKHIVYGSLSNVRISRSNEISKSIYKFYCEYGSIRKFLINIYFNSKKELFKITFLGLKFNSRKIARLIKKMRGEI